MTDTSLTVPEQLGLGEVELQEIESVWDTIDASMVNAMKAGFSLPPRPAMPCPELIPEQVVNLNTVQFTHTLALLEAWQSYAQGQLAVLESYILQCNNQMEMIEVDTKENIRQLVKRKEIKKPPEAEIKDKVKLNTRWRALLLKKQQCQQELSLVETRRAAASRTKGILVSSVQKQKADQGRG